MVLDEGAGAALAVIETPLGGRTYKVLEVRNAAEAVRRIARTRD
jgi:hypothetical protein